MEPLPETMVNEAKASPTSDLVLVDPITELVHILIDVCYSGGLKKDLQNVIDLLDNGLYDIQEDFVYNYKAEKWYHYHAGNGGLIEESSFSEVLQLDLAQFLHP